MNLVQDKKTKKYYALIEPDLVRSYTLQIDIDRNTTNRINLIERVHAYVIATKTTNSSWANYGYLVTAEIDSDVMDECKLLANQFGIGLIKLIHF